MRTPPPRLAVLALVLCPLALLSASCSDRAPNDIRDLPDGSSGVDTAAGVDAALDGQQAPHDALSVDLAATPPDGTTLPIDATAGIDAAVGVDAAESVDSRSGIDVAPGETLSPAALTVDPASASLLALSPEGAVPPQASDAAVFRVRNDSNTKSGLLKVAIVPDNGHFKIVSDSCDGEVLPAHETCAIAVSYAPPISDRETATLVVTNTSSIESVTVALDGQTANGTCLMVTPIIGDLGSVYPGAIGTETLVTVLNGCTAYDLGKMDFAITGLDASVFRISTNTCSNLLRKSSCVIGVELAPPTDAQPKTVSGTMTVVGANGGDQQVALRGMIASKSDPVLPNPSSITFGSVPVGQATTQTVTITNYGGTSTGPLTITISGTGSAQVTIVASTCTASLAPGASCQIKLQYLPSDNAGVTGMITVTDGAHSLSIPMVGAAMEVNQRDASAGSAVDGYADLGWE